MRLVLDASVALKWVLNSLHEADVRLAEGILWAIRNEAAVLLSPPHWIAEVLAVVARKDAARLDHTFEILYGLNHSEISSEITHLLAARMSVQMNHHLFDTLYHAVAIEHGAVLITSDEQYFRKARGMGSIELLTNFKL